MDIIIDATFWLVVVKKLGLILVSKLLVKALIDRYEPPLRGLIQEDEGINLGVNY
jgi:hypothetical protein